MLRLLATAVVAAAVLVGVPTAGTAGAQSACADLGGTVNPDQTCHVQRETSSYTLDFNFPTNYPDQQPLTDFLIQSRDDFVEFAQIPPEHDWPYSLAVQSTTFQSGSPGSGTHSVVLRLSQDANPRPVTYFKAFNYHLRNRAPITLDTLFAPGTNAVDAVYPAVRRELEKRWQQDVLADMLSEPDETTFQNFALTGDAVIFFIGQGQLLGHPEGPIEVSVPRSELPTLAV